MCEAKSNYYIRQRGIGNPNPAKLGRCFSFLNEYYGFGHGGDRKSKEKVFTLISDEPLNQTELAESYGITKQTMNNYMRMASMIPELEDLVDTGIVTKDTALAFVKYMLPFQKAIGELISGGFNRYFV